MLNHYHAIADAITLLFAPYAEVALHDLASQKLVYISNNRSQRELGEDSNLSEIQDDRGLQVIGPYLKRNWDGSQLRSISAVLRDDNGDPIGLMCINLDITVLESAKAALEVFLGGNALQPQPDVLFQDDWQERINTFLHAWLRERQLSLNLLTRDHKRELVLALHAEGAFKGKSASHYVANVLNMGRATVYKHLKEAKAG